MLRPTFRTKYSKRSDSESADIGIENGVHGGDETLHDESVTEEFVDATDQTPTESPLPKSEREIYEIQLTQLQEQLVAVMIENQDMKNELDTLKSTELEHVMHELEEEKNKNRKLSKELETKKVPKISKKKEDKRPASLSSWYVNPEDADAYQGNEWIYLPDSQQNGIPSTSTDRQETGISESGGIQAIPGHQPDPQIMESSLSQASDGTQDNANLVPAVKPVSRIQSFKRTIFYQFMDFISDFLDSGGEDDQQDSDVEEPLAVKRLKENINRFGTGIQPITSSVKTVNNIGTWKNPAATVLTFMIYLYSVWKGYFISLILLIMIWKLTINYLQRKGILSPRVKAVDEEDTEEIQRSLSDKFQLVLQVAAKVQNKLGEAADSLEKMKNLLMWHHPEAAKRLYLMLCFGFLASIFLPAEVILKICAMQLGIKVFVINPIYKKYPKVKKKHDTVAKLWSELPTDADLQARETSINNQSNQQNRNSGSFETTAEPNTAPSHSAEISTFHERFGLPPSEIPLPDWDIGYRCTSMNKDKPLTHMKHGRLYLTPNYICFDHPTNITIPLSEVTHVLKAKPLSFMPGTGMALEIQVSGIEKPYLFGGIIGRDEAYDAIHSSGRGLGLSWANRFTGRLNSPTVQYVRNRAESN